MKLAQFRKNVGMHVNLQPVAVRLDERGNELSDFNDDWRIADVTNDFVEIRNIHTGHFVRLGPDHIHHFDTNPGRTSPGVRYGFLTLTVQVFLQGHNAHLRPTRPGVRATIDGKTAQDRAARASLLDERLVRVSQDYALRGTPAPMIETFDDLSLDEKATLYDRAVRLKKGRAPRSNPFRS